MFDLTAGPDTIGYSTGNSYTPMASRSMPTAKTFVEVHSDCDQQSHFASDRLHAVDRARPTRAVNDHVAWCCASATYPVDPRGSRVAAAASRSSRSSDADCSLNTTTTSTMMSTVSGHAPMWTRRQDGASPAHVWRHDSAVRPPTMHANTVSVRGLYDEFGAGGVNVKEEYSDPASDYSSDTCSDFDWTTSRRPAPAANGANSASALTDFRHASCHMTDTVQSLAGRNRRSPHDKLAADDEQRRQIRRERNKLAAARCRQRRVDLTNQLLTETESLEDEKLRLEKEISNLQRQRCQLEFVLDSHASRCRHMMRAGGTPAQNHVNDMTTGSPAVTSVQSLTSRSFPFGGVAAAAPPGPLKMEDRSYSRASRGGAGRPSSLPISIPGSVGGSSAGGRATTPMMFASLGLDCMVDGHTGLTPITGSPSCSAGGPRPHDDMSPTTLMTL